MTELNPAEHDLVHQRPTTHRPSHAVTTPDGLRHERHYMPTSGWVLRCGRDDYRSLTDLDAPVDDEALSCGGCRSFAVRFRGAAPTEASLAWDRDRLQESSRRWERVEQPATAGGRFDPADHTVREVNDYLGRADDAERHRVLDAEIAGKARVRVLRGRVP